MLIVGAGLYGSTCAHELTKKGFRCLIIEKRDHIGGNCFTEQRDGIQIHKYGPHIFHTSNKRIWTWVKQFADFNHYRHTVRINAGNQIYSLPLNLMTFHQLWGVKTPTEAIAHLEKVKLDHQDFKTLEGWILSKVGTEIYEKFFKEYSRKQWGQCPSQLPSSIIKRLPIRFSFNDNYFDDTYQGIPIGGYTAMFEEMLTGIEVRLNVDYFENRHFFDSLAAKVLYTGPIDRFFDYCFGTLKYRSMRFEHMRYDIPDFQGVAQVNYTSADVPFTRIVEHKHFEFGSQPTTWITREYPQITGQNQEPMYPVKDDADQQIWLHYKAMCEQSKYRRYYFGGRLASYQYYDMHQVIGAALDQLTTIEHDLSNFDTHD